MKQIKGPQILKLRYKTLYVLFSYVSLWGGRLQRTYVTFPRFERVLVLGLSTEI